MVCAPLNKCRGTRSRAEVWMTDLGGKKPRKPLSSTACGQLRTVNPPNPLGISEIAQDLFANADCPEHAPGGIGRGLSGQWGIFRESSAILYKRVRERWAEYPDCGAVFMKGTSTKNDSPKANSVPSSLLCANWYHLLLIQTQEANIQVRNDCLCKWSLFGWVSGGDSSPRAEVLYLEQSASQSIITKDYVREEILSLWNERVRRVLSWWRIRSEVCQLQCVSDLPHSLRCALILLILEWEGHEL